jgi:hypothetical protein
MEWLRALSVSLNPDAENGVDFANEIVDAALLLGAWELRGTVLGLYDRGLADPGYVELEYVEEKLVPGAELNEPEKDRLADTVTDAWEAVSGWAFFDPDEPGYGLPVRPPKSLLDPPPMPIDDDYASGVPQPYAAPYKPGRNDPCPCGSGKKFKKCCGAGSSVVRSWRRMFWAG